MFRHVSQSGQTLGNISEKHRETSNVSLGNIVAKTLLPTNVSPCFPEWANTIGSISEKHRETSNVSEFARKHFCFPGGQTWKHLRKHRESQMFPQLFRNNVS
jgi:hypothetical protein